MAAPDRNAPRIKDSEQNVLNDSFDETYGTLVVQQVAYDGSALLRNTSEQTATRIDDTTTANTTYIGKAPIGSATSSAVWQISKLDTSSGLIKTWADGDASFNNVWDDRVSLSYS